MPTTESSIRNGSDELYGPVIREYNRDVVRGRPLDLTQLLELLALEYRQAMQTPVKSEIMTGLSITKQCTHCKKTGHTTDECWNKDPKKAPRRDPRRYQRRERPSRKNQECWKCGERGHFKSDCEKSSITKNIGISATIKDNNTPVINCYMPYFVDSGCTCHLVASLNALENPYPEPATLTAVGGHSVWVTHRGRARIAR